MLSYMCTIQGTNRHMWVGWTQGWVDSLCHHIDYNLIIAFIATYGNSLPTVADQLVIENCEKSAMWVQITLSYILLLSLVLNVVLCFCKLQKYVCPLNCTLAIK